MLLKKYWTKVLTMIDFKIIFSKDKKMKPMIPFLNSIPKDV